MSELITLRRRTPRGIALAASLLGGFALSAQAQLALEEVVVTSQKRVQSLGDVPISVNVMSGDKIAESGITNLNDLSDFVPNLSMNQTGLSTTITIRGISSGINAAFEQSVGMYVDDIHYGRMQMARIPYLDVDRVEVLRGPQPILFGKNAIGGAISLITKKASTEEMSGFVAADVNFDEGGEEFSGAINVPLSDEFAVRISGLSRDVDGYFENTFLDRDESGLSHRMGRVNFQWDATDNLSMNFKYTYASFDTDGRFVEIINPVSNGPGAAYSDVVSALSGGQIQLDTTQDFKRQSNGDIENTNFDNATFSLEYALGDHTLTAVSGWAEYDYFLQCDCDFTSVVLIDTASTEDFKQFSQELRLTSPGGETVDYIIGAFYQTYDLSLDSSLLIPANSAIGPLLGGIGGTGVRTDYFTDSDMWSVFAQATWNISDTVRVTVGGRYTEEDKSGRRRKEVIDLVDASPIRNLVEQPLTTNAAAAGVYGGVFQIDTENSFGNLNNFSGETNCGGASDAVGHNLACDRSEGKFTPAVNIQWDATDNTMVYASVTQGFKSGGFDQAGDNTGSFEFEDEEVTAYEVGAKMVLAGGAAELNASAYRMEYDNLQTSQFNGVLGFNVTNAAAATSQGVELDGRWQASENLLLTGAIGFLDFEFDNFTDSQCFFGEVLTTAELTRQAATGLTLCDRTGEAKEFTPEVTANVGATYFIAIGSSMEMSLGVDLAYSDEYSVSPTLDPNLTQDAYTKVNARIALASVEGTWSVALAGENLTDEEILTFGNSAPLATTLTGGVSNAYYGFYESPMNVSLQARYNF